MTIELTDENFEEKTQEGIWIIDCWAPWCGPCQMFAPIVDEVADETGEEIHVAKLNTDENKETAAKLGIMSIPTVLYIQDGEIVDRSLGVLSKQQFMERIREIFE